MRRSLLLLSTAFAFSSLVGCALLDPASYLPPGLGDDGDDGDAPGGDSCTGDDLGLSVATDSLTPTITFTGDAAGLGVSLPAPDSGTRLWVLSMTTAPFISPVTYGTVPDGAVEAEGAAVALEAATTYWVTLTSGDGASAQCAEWTTP
jgi:hypothetical protein